MRQLTLRSLLLRKKLLSWQRLLWCLSSCVLEWTHSVRLSCLLLCRLLLLLFWYRLLLDGILPAHLGHIARICLLLNHHCRLLLSHVDEAVALWDDFVCGLVGSLWSLLRKVRQVGTWLNIFTDVLLLLFESLFLFGDGCACLESMSVCGGRSLLLMRYLSLNNCFTLMSYVTHSHGTWLRALVSILLLQMSLWIHCIRSDYLLSRAKTALLIAPATPSMVMMSHSGCSHHAGRGVLYLGVTLHWGLSWIHSGCLVRGHVPSSRGLLGARTFLQISLCCLWTDALCLENASRALNLVEFLMLQVMLMGVDNIDACEMMMVVWIVKC